MPLLAMLVGLFAGLAVWGILEQIQSRQVKKIFDEELRTRLELRARESLIRFDQYLTNYGATVRLLANHRRLAEYLEPLFWDAQSPPEPVRYQGSRPDWLPDFFTRNDLSPPSQVFLVDRRGRIRESFQAGSQPSPPEFSTTVDSRFLDPSEVRTVLTDLEDHLYLVVSDAMEDLGGYRMGSLVVLVPVDQAFLVASQRGLVAADTLVALVDSEEQEILVSIDPERLFPHTQVSQWTDTYLVTAQSLSQYEGSELNLVFSTFISHAGVEKMSRHVRHFERRQRGIAALVFIGTFTLLLYLISLRLNSVLQRLSRFSHRALGIAEPQFSRGANRLILLEEWIQQFTQLVLRAREEMNRQHARAMRRSEALKAAVMEASLDAIVTLDARGRIEEWNPAAQHLFGLPRQSVIGQDFHRLFLPKLTRGTFFALLQAAHRTPTQGADTRAELLAQRMDGREFPVELSIVFLRLEERPFYTLYLHDISQRKAAEEELRQHQAELVHVCRLSTLGEVATGMAHELNQPLSAITNYANGCIRRLRQGQGEPEALIPALDQISAQAQRAGEILRRLRGLVGKQPPVREAVDLNSLVREVCSFLAFETKRMGLEIERDLSAQPIPVFVDLVQIEQVLLNLVRNALDALSSLPAEERRLRIHTVRKGDWAEVMVQDNGPGIPADCFPHLFDPFFTTKENGMGMGLPISQTILHNHQGRIWAESQPQAGTIFSIRLPIQEEP